MNTIYIDYNLIVIMARRTRENAEELKFHVQQLIQNGYRVALSAWHAFELSRSDNLDQIESCIELIECLQPVWLSNPIYVKREEIKGFLGSEWGDTRLQAHPNPGFNTSVSQMWSTYHCEAYVGESFCDTVLAMHKNPASRQEIDKAVRDAPNALLIGRNAEKNGTAKQLEHIVDREYFKSLVPHHVSKKAIIYLLNNVRSVLTACPSVTIENYLTRIRLSENFTPKESDAVDLQHAIVGLAYCDYFISDDKMLVEHGKRSVTQANLTCNVGTDLLRITAS